MPLLRLVTCFVAPVLLVTLIANLWHYLKSHFWSNRVYDDYDALMDAAETA